MISIQLTPPWLSQIGEEKVETERNMEWERRDSVGRREL
jgi:hypothetical protein